MTEQITSTQRASLGIVARTLTSYALQDPARRLTLFPTALTGVCRMIESAPEESTQLICDAIAVSQSEHVRAKCLWWIAHNIQFLFGPQPSLAATVYRLAFEAPVLSTEPTPMADGAIFRLTSTLRQDYQLATHQLAKTFGEFIENSAADAVPLLCDLLRAYAQEKCRLHGEQVTLHFEFDGHEVAFSADGSYFWDERSGNKHDPPYMMLGAFESCIEQMAVDGRSEDLSAVLGLVAQHNPPAVLWRRLLQVGSRHTEALGKRLTPMLKAAAILVTPDTRLPASELLSVVFPLLGEDDREEIETAILELPENELLEDDERRELKRDRLLCQLPREFVVSESVIRRLDELDGQTSPEEEQPFRFNSSGPSGEEIRRRMYEQRGIPYDDPVNVEFRQLIHPIEECCSKYLNETPPSGEIAQLVPAVKQLSVALEDADVRGVHESFATIALGTLAAACERMLRNQETVKNQEVLRLVKAILLAASTSSSPKFSEESNESFDRFANSGGRVPRTEAAEGLMSLARHAEGATPDVLDAIEQLSRDRCNSVRYNIAQRLVSLYHTAPELMWQIADGMASNDSSYAIVEDLVQNFLQRLLALHTDRVILMAFGIFERFPSVENLASPREACLSLFRIAYLRLNNESARKLLLEQLAADIDAFAHEAGVLIHGLRSSLGWQPPEAPNRPSDDARQRAWELLNTILTSATVKWTELCDAYGSTPRAGIPTEVATMWQSLAQLFDLAALELSFAQGVYDEEEFVNGATDASAPSQEVKTVFWNESQATLDILESVGLAPAVHHLIEFLNGYIQIDPKAVFLRIGRIIDVSESGGYQHDSLAVGLVMKIVERYLAEYRFVFRESNECRDLLIRVLDIFVGWPDAQRLAYRLEDIYR